MLQFSPILHFYLMLCLAAVEADAFLLSHQSSKLWSTAAANTKETGNSRAKPGSCVQTKACVAAEDNQAVEFPLLVYFFYPCFLHLYMLPFYSFQHQSLLPCSQFDRTMLGTLFCSKKSTGRQLPPHHSPGYCEQRANCQ